MKITKTLLIICMAALMGICATIPHTFSWFTRADAKQGQVLKYVRTKLPVSNGNLSSFVLTNECYKMSNNQIVLHSVTKEKVVDSTLLFSVNENRTVSNMQIKYFKTKVSNDTTRTAYIDLYMNDATNSSKFYVGTINPVLTEKQVGTPTRTAVNNSEIRAYFQIAMSSSGDNNNKWAVSSPTLYLYAKVGTRYEKVLLQKGASQYANKAPDQSGDVDTYYADIPANTSEFFFSNTNKTWQSSDDDATVEGKVNEITEFKRTPSFSTFKPGTLYYLTGKTTDDNKKNAQCGTYQMDDGLSVPKYFSDVYSAPRRSAYLKLPQGTVGTVAYSAYTEGDTTIEVTAQTGRVKIVSNTTGSGGADGHKVLTTVTGPIGDTKQFVTTIHVPDTIDDFPICRNIKIEGKKEAVIEWYVANKTPSNATSVNCTFSSDVYVTR